MSSSSIEKAHLNFHAEIGLLKKALADKQAELQTMRSAVFAETDRRGEIEDVVLAWQDKFERLYESHKKVQKINQTLEDKLLKLVDRNSSERAQLTSDCATLNIRLTQANYNISNLQRELERYKQDINLAIQLLHCKPDNFLPQKVNSLPLEMQAKVASYMKFGADESESRKENPAKGKYQILPTSEDGTFPINLDHNKNGEINVSPLVVAKFLENELKSKTVKHCDTCSCAKKHMAEVEGIQMIFNIGTQTDMALNCLRCNSNLNSPSHTNSPYLIKLKSSDSVISTKSSVSDFGTHNDKSYTPSKVDDLKVNPILGHHRLCEHTKSFNCQPKTEEIIKGLDPIPVDNPSERKNVRNREKSGDIKSPSLSHNSNNSKTSSREGAKLFENFNRNLIKAMRAENPRKVTPRICALKLQDGSNNITLDSPLGALSYTRRPRLLDEELLDEEKDISGNVPMNFESSQSSMVLSTESNRSNNNHEIFSTNKTDSEKFNEIQGKDVLVPVENSPPVVPISAQSLNRNVNSGTVKNVRNAEIFCETASGEIEIHDNIQNILLRRQQLTRVAEWVQNSSNIPLPNSPIQIRDQKALEFEKNACVATNQIVKESEANAQYNLNEKLTNGNEFYKEQENLSIKSESDEDEKLDLAQMEYNVKKFLLGNRSIFSDTYSNKSDCEDEVIFSKGNFIVQRTETNL